MTLNQLAKKLDVKTRTLEERAGYLLVAEALRAVEAELFSLMSRYGVKTVEEFDKKIAKGELSEEELDEDFFRFDYLSSQKGKLEKLLIKFPKEREEISPWVTIASLPESLKLNFLQ